MNLSKVKRYAGLPRLSAHEVGRPHFLLRNPLIPGMGNFLVQPVYDYYGVAANTATTRQALFAIPQNSNYTPAGGAQFTKTFVHTSLIQAGQLEAPKRQLVKCIGVILDAETNQLDAARFASQAQVRFQFSDDVVFLDVLLGLCGRGALSWSSQARDGDTAGTPVVVGSVGLGLPGASVGFGLCDDGVPGTAFDAQIHGIAIEQQEAFRVVIDPTQAAHVAAVGFTTQLGAAVPAGIGIRAWIQLEGIQARATR